MTATFATVHADRPKQLLNAGLAVDRTDIAFHNVTPDFVEIQIRVTNQADDFSRPTFATICSAPLGAFVRCRPLCVVPVPALAPGDSHVLRVVARTPRALSLGTPDRVPPRELLIAAGAGDGEPDDVRALTATGGAGDVSRAILARRSTPGELAPDVFQLMSRPGAHWAGNLNIFIGSQSVERHLAQALRVYPGRLNYAFFLVGSGPDAYAFELQGPPDWKARLFDMSCMGSRGVGSFGTLEVPPRQWIETSGAGMMILATSPPALCDIGQVDVHVRQRSTGRSTVVEFCLDAHAAGAGCYVV